MDAQRYTTETMKNEAHLAKFRHEFTFIRAGKAHKVNSIVP